MRRIVIDLYDHTKEDEIEDILDSLRCIGIDDARVEAKLPDTVGIHGWVTVSNGYSREA